MRRALVLLPAVLLVLHGESAGAQGDKTLTIADVVRTARTRSPDVRDALAQAESASAAVDAAYAGYVPSAKAEVGANRAWAHSYKPNTTTGLLESAPQVGVGTNAAADVRWTAWDFGRTSSAVGAAKAESLAASARAQATTNDVTKTSAILFLTALYDDDLVFCAETTLRLRERHAALSRAMVESGIRPPIEEARARVELSFARLDLTRAEQQRSQDRVKLSTILLRNPTEQVRLVKPALLPHLGVDARRAAEQALQNRPEIAAANATVIATEERAGIVEAGRLPSFGLSLEAAHQTNKPDGDPRFFPTRTLGASATLNIPIFDWKVWGNIPVARANAAAAEARASGTRAKVQGQAAEAAYALKAAVALLTQANEARELAAVTLVVIEARYQAGRDGPLDLFQAAQKDADARTAAIKAELALSVATIELLAATGRLPELAK